MLEKIESLLGSIDRREPLDSDVADWLKEGIRKKINTSDSLDTILGTSNLRCQYLRKERDQHLIAAWETLDETLTDWGRSCELARLLRNFEAGRWRNLEYIPIPPVNLPETQRHLFWALKTGIKAPSSARHIHNIVKS